MITSVHNSRVAKAVRLKKRAIRDRERRFLVEGAQGVAEAIEAGGPVHAVFHTHPPGGRLEGLLERARGAGVPVFQVSDDVMGRLTSTVTPQGVVAVADFVDVSLEALPGDAQCVAVLVEVRDPGNAGTIVRTADAAGADGVVFTSASVDLYNEKAVRATAGSLFHLPVVREAPLERAARALRSRGMTILAAAPQGATPAHLADLTRPTALLFGNEAHGLPDEALALADGTIRVPISGRAESLNLAAATAVVLFESARQRAAGPPLASLVAGAAHDIRSPLGSMVAFTSTLLARWESLDDEQKATMVRGMAFDAARMRSLVAQLVDAARLSSGRLELAPATVEVMEVAGKAVREASHPDLPEVELSGQGAAVLADPSRVHTIVGALIEAARWWGDRGPIRVEVQPDADGARVEVTRAGSSPDSEGLRALFAPRDPGAGGGSKVGLYVARGLAEAHGGSLGVEAADGIRFTLRLPAGRP